MNIITIKFEDEIFTLNVKAIKMMSYTNTGDLVIEFGDSTYKSSGKVAKAVHEAIQKEINKEYRNARNINAFIPYLYGKLQERQYKTR